MKVVNYTKAADIAGVTRQRIYNIKKDIEKGLSKHQFLAYDSEKKRMGVDIDHPDWLHYCNKNKHHLNKKKVQRKKLIRKDVTPEKNDSVNQNKLIDSVVKALDDTFEMSKKDRTDLLELIEKYYEEG